VAFENDPQLRAEAKLGALLSGLMGPVSLGIARLPCWRNASAAKKRTGACAREAEAQAAAEVPTRVPDSKLKAVSVATEREDSFILQDTPAALTLGYRQNAYYRHAIRAGDNRLAAHPDVLEKPRLFAVDPEASARARGRWQLAKVSPGSSRILALAAEAYGTEEERGQMQRASVIGFLQKSASERQGMALPAVPPDLAAADAPVMDVVTEFAAAPVLAPADQ